MWRSPTERDRSARPGRGRRAGGLAPAAGAALALLLAACTSTLDGNLRQTAQLSKTGDNELTSLVSQVDATAEGDLGPDAEYRLSDRLIYRDFGQDVGGVSSDTTQFLHQPSLETVLRSGPLEWTQQLNVEDTRTKLSDADDNDRLRTILLEQLIWAPEELPRLTARLDRRTDEDDTFTNREEIYTVLQLDDERGPFRWLYAFETQTLTDRDSDLDRTGIENRYRAEWRDDFQQGDLYTSVTVAGRLRTDRAEFEGPTTVVPPGEVFPSQGLSVVDTTPTFAILNSTPELIDGDESTPTTINIGGFAGGGLNSWNIGVGLGSTELINTVLLTTDVEVPSFLVDQFTFSVWSSADNNTWSLVDGSAAYTYDDVNRRFRISFSAVGDLYLKIVNEVSPPSAPALFVTEMRVFAPSGGGGAAENVRDFSQHNVRGNISYRGIDDVALTWDVFGQVSDTEDNGQLVRDEARLDNTLGAQWALHGQVDLNLVAETRNIDDKVNVDENQALVGGTLIYRPLETLDLGATHNWSTRELGAISDYTSNSSQLRATAQLLETLEGEISFQRIVTEDDVQDIETDRDVFSAGLVARMTPRFDVTFRWTKDMAELGGSGAVGLPDPTSDIYETNLLWRMTSRLRAEARFYWRDTSFGRGLDQGYRLDWTPLPDGTVDITVNILRRVDGLQELSTDTYLFTVQWLLAPRARLDLNYAAQVPDEDDRTDQVTAVLNIGF